MVIAPVIAQSDTSGTRPKKTSPDEVISHHAPIFLPQSGSGVRVRRTFMMKDPI